MHNTTVLYMGMSTSKNTIDWYNENADKYSDHVNSPDESPHHTYYEKPAIRAELPDLEGKKVLTLGCGNGRECRFIKDQGAEHVVGIDVSEKLIDIAKSSHDDIDFQVMGMEKLDFEYDSFDLIYSSLAVHYVLGGLGEVFHEAYRVLKPGGLLLFSDGHPIGSALELVQDDESTKRRALEIIKNKAEDIETIHGDYLTSRTVNGGVDFSVEFWHQPISITVNQLVEAGFVIEKMIEPLPQEGFKKVSPRLYERLSRLPDFMIFKARKP